MHNSFAAMFAPSVPTVAELAVPGATPLSVAPRGLPVSIQVDAVCPFCDHWHTVATRNGIPSCHVIESPHPRAFQRTGGMQ